MQSQGTLYGATWGLYLVSDILYLIAFPALYLALRTASRASILIALIFNTAFVIIDIGIDIPLSLSLIGLSGSYASAQSVGQRAAYVAAAELAMGASRIASLIATFLQFFAIILASLAMLRSRAFGRLGYVGLLSGVLAILFIPSIILAPQLAGLFNISGFVFLVIWSVVAGYRLYKFR